MGHQLGNWWLINVSWHLVIHISMLHIYYSIINGEEQVPDSRLILGNGVPTQARCFSSNPSTTHAFFFFSASPSVGAAGAAPGPRPSRRRRGVDVHRRGRDGRGEGRLDACGLFLRCVCDRPKDQVSELRRFRVSTSSLLPASFRRGISMHAWSCMGVFVYILDDLRLIPRLLRS